MWRNTMAKRNIIPFGPQHPVLLEAIHFDLVTEDETVVDAIPVIGYVHRGLEKLVEKKDFIEYTYVAERICGICGFMHGFGYCQTVEQVLDIEVPERAVYLRTIWSELSRINSHLLWLGFAADAMGFESLFMHSFRLRESVLDIIEATAGGRMIFGCVKIGGVRRDIEGSVLRGIVAKLQDLEPKIREITNVFLDDYSTRHRMEGVGVISKEDAYHMGMVGPMIRASGIPSDTRQIGYAAYKHVQFEPATAETGDCYGRCVVRVKEIFESINIVRQLVDKTPDGPIDVKVKGTPSGEFFGRIEQPRGEVIYYVKGNGTKFLERFRVRVPTFANLPGMIQVLKGSQIADVPVIILTIDPCISCTER
jgi:ech hydrogenase subunit E